MDKNFYIVSITEENVDGCGSDATELVKIDHVPTAEEVNQLEQTLAEIKHTAVDEDLCTEDMVVEALNRTFGGRWEYISSTAIAIKF